MAYQAKRQARIEEELELVNKDGSIYRTLKTDLTVDAIAKEFRQLQLDLVRAQQQTVESDDLTDKRKQVGDAFIKLLQLIFGEEDTVTILTFYEHNYIEMVQEITPFIAECISPAIMQAVKERRQTVAKQNHLNRAQKRKMMRA